MFWLLLILTLMMWAFALFWTRFVEGDEFDKHDLGFLIVWTLILWGTGLFFRFLAQDITRWFIEHSVF